MTLGSHTGRRTYVRGLPLKRAERAFVRRKQRRQFAIMEVCVDTVANFVVRGVLPGSS